ncbi:hypothetical protein AQUCO_04800021v1 [Aquilegia coerulea]|uniref:non-specific serine/threonine protein kinase n=1 Tax=Aquilegia coerulea TaxID=218851 RepID=A0A2G5CKI9_AQUCA|nr:hypothetical protein AQUCO_04800021v1 [Aquilegia coerulea]
MALKKIMCLVLLIHYAAAFSIGSHHLLHHQQNSLLTDKTALLAFKKTITPDRQSALENWNEMFDVCNFTGVVCSPRRHRVFKLLLNNTNIEGLLSPFIANLTGLRKLDLSQNKLFGLIPTEFAQLRFLWFLKLDGNLLHGKIPESLSFLWRLRYVHLGDNNLAGIIPASIFSNCTSLRYVDFSINSLNGEIPSEVGNPPELWGLNLYVNHLRGKIPLSLANASNLYTLDLENNHFSGELPSEVVSKLNLLTNLHLSYNYMVSHASNTNLEPFLASLINCTCLEELELAGMGLGGRLSNTIGLLSTTLSKIHLEDNRIFGMIPPNVGNLLNLTLLNLSSNLLNGTIPVEIGQLEKLEQLILSNNSFSGGVPATLGQIRSIGLLDLSRNRLTGVIPASLGDLSLLNYLFLNNNDLSGEIPSSLGKCRDLHKLDLSYNKLTGRIPPKIPGLGEIRIFLNLSNNLLQGPLPYEISKLESVQQIDLSSNNLTGNIFPQLSNCISINLLNLSHNSFEGQLPESLGELRNLESLDVSNNSLSGLIPSSFSKCPNLASLNLSFNHFSGPIPTGGIFKSVTCLTFLGNPHLCGSVTGIPICVRRKHSLHSRKFLVTISTVVSVSLFLMTICCAIGYRHIKQIISREKDELLSESAPALKLNFPRVTYKELSEATQGFDQGKLIGSGSYGEVYQGVLRDGTAVAIKVLRLQTGNSTKSFNRECQVLKRIRHRNLMRIVTAYSLPDFKALVLPYMSNGSLDNHLYPQPDTGTGSNSLDLSLIQRVNICSDIAEGMAYLHHHSPVKVIHCDLKPSNVLLNDDMTALVSDFGIARLVMTIGVGNSALVENMGNSTANILCGSIGYIAPEYGFGSSTSTKGDVYSFGILVLEMVTRKRPTDGMFNGGLSLHKWVKNHYHGRVEKVIDSSLVRTTRDQAPEVMKMWEVAIAELLELGLLCTQEVPSTRPTMLDAADDLDRLKRYLDGDTTATFASSLGISSSTVDDD